MLEIEQIYDLKLEKHVAAPMVGTIAVETTVVEEIYNVNTLSELNVRDTNLEQEIRNKLN
jgi:hypothetical protein